MRFPVLSALSLGAFLNLVGCATAPLCVNTVPADQAPQLVNGIAANPPPRNPLPITEKDAVPACGTDVPCSFPTLSATPYTPACSSKLPTKDRCRELNEATKRDMAALRTMEEVCDFVSCHGLPVTGRPYMKDPSDEWQVGDDASKDSGIPAIPLQDKHE